MFNWNNEMLQGKDKHLNFVVIGYKDKRIEGYGNLLHLRDVYVLVLDSMDKLISCGG